MKASVDKVEALAKEVIQGKWGNGQERYDKLTAAGYNYDEVQGKVNELLKKTLAAAGVTLVDFKLEFGRLGDGSIVLADEISPDTCRFWDTKTGEKLDKDRFRRDLGNVEDAYSEMMRRILG